MLPHAPATLPNMDADWDALLRRRDDPDAPPPPGPLGALFGPVLAPAHAADGCRVIGRLAQTLDGRIAAPNGSSRWIGGAGDIRHTHRLRALCDAVLVGAATVALDDPLLTTRAVAGPHPVRVVLDRAGRLGTDHAIFRGGPPTLLIRAEGARGGGTHGSAAVLRVAERDGSLDLRAVLAALAARQLRRVFVEGGGVTVSRFLAAGLLDRLHLTVAPVLLGSGVPAFTLPPATCIGDGLRVAWTTYPLDGGDLLCDLALDRARPAVCA